MSNPRTVVFGIDGAHFELIEDWLKQGDLPNIKKVLEEGVSADLESVLPPVTSPNWKAYATGKNPGRFGIFWWENIDTDAEDVYYPGGRRREEKEYWEYISESTPVGVLGVPTTYPPVELNGFYVSGAPDGAKTNYARPTEVESLLEEQFDYQVLKSGRLQEDGNEAAIELLELIESRFESAMHLAQEYNVSFLQVTTFYINSLHHFLWDSDYTLRAWKIVDEYVGHFYDDDWNVVLMSDHGSTEISTVFNINTWFENEGYLQREESIADFMYRLGFTKDRLATLAKKIGIRDLTLELLPAEVRQRIPDNEGGVRRSAKASRIDWSETVAVASGQGPVYLTLDGDDPEYNRVRQNLIDDLASLTDRSGNPIATDVFTREQVYTGSFTDEAPDIVIEQADGVHITGDLGRESAFGTPQGNGWKAENKRLGLFAAAGPKFGSGDRKTLSILDLAPTLLHLYGLAVPNGMDGVVRDDVFAVGSEPADREVNRREQDQKLDSEKERIRQITRRSDVF